MNDLAASSRRLACACPLGFPHATTCPNYIDVGTCTSCDNTFGRHFDGCENAPVREWQRGSWMQTFTGRQFWPTSPQAADVDPLDIAHALSLLCRYNGHVDSFYSVAEHCVLMSRAVPTEFALWALLHDATEAYVGDMVRPLKQSLPVFSAVEDRVMVAVAERFGLAIDTEPDGWVLDTDRGITRPKVIMPAPVKDADNRILLTERAALMPNTTRRWVVDGLDPLPVQIEGWMPRYAEAEYLRRLDELLGGEA